VFAFRLTCPECSAELTLSTRRLLVRADAGAGCGECLCTCLMCRAVITVPVDAETVADLAEAGATVVRLVEPLVQHPEDPPTGPAFTADDLLDWHQRLEADADGWLLAPGPDETAR
jgi:hypothetical protein